jgi:hypothetical protein
VRFVGVGAYSLDIEVVSYVMARQRPTRYRDLSISVALCRTITIQLLRVVPDDAGCLRDQRRLSCRAQLQFKYTCAC